MSRLLNVFLTVSVIFVTTISFQNCGSSFAPQLSQLESTLGADQQNILDLDGQPIDMDPAGPLSIYALDSSNIVDQSIQMTIQLNKIDTKDISISWNTVDGDALAGTHYETLSETTIIPAGSLESVILIPILKSENTNINFEVRLVSSSKGVIARASAGILIPADSVEALQNFNKISSGDSHTCTITNMGLVICWGENDFGQLGTGPSMANSLVPTSVINLAGAKQVSAGGKHTCAITAQDNVVCWGRNEKGQLGNSLNNNSAIPTPVENLTGVKKISSGKDHTCALNDQNMVYCWGSNTFGQLGNQSLTDSSIPVLTESLQNIKDISLGDDHSCAITDLGAVTCWGKNDSGTLGDGSQQSSPIPVDVPDLLGIKQLSAGAGHTCAITAQDTVVCWGGNRTGQLGNDTGESSFLPIPVLNLTGAKQISAGSNHTCIVSLQGLTYCWGDNRSGALGNLSQRSLGPDMVSELVGAKEVASGNRYSCAISSQDSLYCWGDNSNGQLGNNSISNSITPAQLEDFTGAKQISTSNGGHTCVVTALGTVQCWGNNTYGQLGDNTRITSPLPVSVANLTGVEHIASRYQHSCAITSQGTVQCWGYNYAGQLGNNTRTPSPIPVDVVNLNGVKQLALGNINSCAVTVKNTVSCWGNNYTYQFGNGVREFSHPTPIAISNLRGVRQLATGGGHRCAITLQNTVLCWEGYNRYGELGYIGSNSINKLPTIVPNLTNVKQLSLGSNHSCALTNGGTVYCWGSNEFGQLGNNSNLTQSITPVLVSGLSGVTSISAGSSHSCAVTDQNTAYCWGSNDRGELGNKSQESSSNPVKMMDIGSIKTISAGKNVTYVLLNNGEVYFYGSKNKYYATPLKVITPL